MMEPQKQDDIATMILDLRNILDGWAYEPGKISVRKIIGRDGREKIQTRIDLGVLQLDKLGRPDGRRPRNCESLLDYHESRLRDFVSQTGSDEDFVLTPEDCRDLRHEGYLFYQRYLSLYVLEEYDGVERDATRHLRLIEFCDRYAATESDRAAVRGQWAYVSMMRTRARAHRAASAGKVETALELIDQGLRDLAGLPQDVETGHAAERQALRALRGEMLAKLPPDSPVRLQSELESALAREDYERAAELRNQITPARPSK